jgi:hypothetical protein
MGLSETQRICKDQHVKRADSLEECAHRIQRHAMDLADVGPADLLQLAQRYIPGDPGQNFAIQYPIEDIGAQGVVLLIPVYRIIYEHTPSPTLNSQGWDPVILARSALGLIIAAHGAMFAGQSLLDIYVDKEKLIRDLKPDKLACPKEMLCTSPDCGGQDENQQVFEMSPICKKVGKSLLNL